MTVVELSGWALEFVSDELKADKEVVMAAVKEEGDALQFSSDELKADEEVIALQKQDD
jgi:hypothetical protein